MTLAEAKAVLKDWTRENGDLHNLSPWVSWFADGNLDVSLDGDFTLEELTAIVTWIKERRANA